MTRLSWMTLLNIYRGAKQQIGLINTHRHLMLYITNCGVGHEKMIEAIFSIFN